MSFLPLHWERVCQVPTVKTTQIWYNAYLQIGKNYYFNNKIPNWYIFHRFFFSVARSLHFFHVTMDTESMMDFNFLLYIVNTRRYCDPEKKTDLETLTDLHNLNLLNKKNWCFLRLFVCLYTWICAWPASEQFGGFYSYWVLKSLYIIGWSLANVNILAPKIGTLQRSSHPQEREREREGVGEKQKNKVVIFLKGSNDLD